MIKSEKCHRQGILENLKIKSARDVVQWYSASGLNSQCPSAHLKCHKVWLKSEEINSLFL